MRCCSSAPPAYAEGYGVGTTVMEQAQVVAAINREKFDYTEWRKHGLSDLSIDEIAARANRLSVSLGSDPRV